ncbi:tyrosine-type recombinase/integrase [Microbulbifer sp. CnH-101-E]|uniref:tyrosine-type recombinase/integrase n=1 Tax=unclassified Microbulbifer TaxID=2619833 RepID=UPI0040396E90
MPPRMHQKHGRYYYVQKNKWRPLAKEYHKSLAMVAAIEAPTPQWSELVSQVYERYERRHADGKLALNTLKQYQSMRPRIEYGFSDFTPDIVRTSDITQFLDLYEDTPNIANRMLTVVKAIFERAVRQGIADINPAFGIKRFEEKKRDRYLTDGEFRAIRSKANPTIKLVMDMCYLTAQRISDVLAIQHSDISKDGIKFQQEKTGKRLLVQMEPELERIITEAKQLHKVMCLFLFHPRGKNTRYSYRGIRDAYERARVKAGVEDTTIHDIRAKSLTDAKRSGIDAQVLAGHVSPAMTERYIRLRETDNVAGPSLRQLLDKRQKSDKNCR